MSYDPYLQGLPRSRRCKGCVYGVRMSGDIFYCDYLTRVGKRRPCPPGDECTVRVTTRQQRARENGEDKHERIPLDRPGVVKMWKDGVAVKVIARYFGISVPYTYQILRESKT